MNIFDESESFLFKIWHSLTNLMVVSQLRTCSPPSFPSLSDHFDIKYAQCAKKIMGLKFLITSYHVWALQPFENDILGAQKFIFLHKWKNLQGRLELIWRSFCARMTFFARFLFLWNMIDFVFVYRTCRNLKNTKFGGGLRSWASDALEWHPIVGTG